MKSVAVSNTIRGAASLNASTKGRADRVATLKPASPCAAATAKLSFKKQAAPVGFKVQAHRNPSRSVVCASAKEPRTMEITEIMELLPHRYPFLLVDRVLEYVPGEYAVGLKNLTINDNFYPGHFPDRPIMPGVLMVEAMAQVGGLIMLNDDVGGSKDNFFFGGVDSCRFKRPVVPGDQLVMKVTLTKLNKRFGIAKFDAKAYVEDQLACEAELMLVLGS